MHKFLKNKKGFTLVELLIVVAILGILAAIAIPQFVKYKRNAAIAQCNADLKNYILEATATLALNGSKENATHELMGNKFWAGKIWLSIEPNSGIVSFLQGGSETGGTITDEIDAAEFDAAANVDSEWFLYDGFRVRIDNNLPNCTVTN